MSTTTPRTPASRGQLTTQAADAAIDSACRKLGLPTVRAQAGPLIAQATRTHAPYAAFLAELLIAECEDRDQRATTRRLKAAGFPRQKYLADFDHAAARSQVIWPHLSSRMLAPGGGSSGGGCSSS